MMTHFPYPYEDELLYSVISRYGIRSGNTSHKAILADVFGSENFTACMELQPGIRRIVQNLPLGSTITEEQLLFRNTMFLFYTAFRDEEQAQFIRNEMLGDHGRDIHNAIGLMSSTVKPHSYFQYCPLCNETDLKTLGELYWRRLFQIPGVKICVKHGVWLNQSMVPIRGTTKYAFTAPTLTNCPDDKVQKVTEKALLNHYGYIINNIEKLLNTKYPHRPQEWFYLVYKHHLMKKGYATERGRVDQKRLKKDFVDFYGEELLNILQSSVKGESNWLRLIFQKHRKGFHPIRHLLVIHFLGLTLEDVFYAQEYPLNNDHEIKANRPKRKIMKKTMTKEYKEQARNERREAWLQMRKQYPNLSRLQLRKLNPKVYAWLYLYDREFLMENMPEKMTSKAKTLRHDWEKRDKETLEQVRIAVQQMMDEEGKPKRITKKRIQELIGKQCLMSKHLKKMPLTKEYLDQVIEDSEKFKKRRIEWAIHELKREKEPITLNRIKAKSGVSKVEQVLNDNREFKNYFYRIDL
jgi:hypothetical protein